VLLSFITFNFTFAFCLLLFFFTLAFSFEKTKAKDKNYEKSKSKRSKITAVALLRTFIISSDCQAHFTAVYDNATSLISLNNHLGP